MRGEGHAITGAASGTYAPLAAPALLGITAWSPEHGAFAAAVLAWSIGPDIDHGRRSTAKNMWGPVSAAPSHLLGKLAGGHRGATHHVLAAAVVAALVIASHGHPVALGIVYAWTLGMAIAAIDVLAASVRATWWQNLAMSVLGASALVYAGATWTWLPYAAGLGVLVHIAGDRIRIGSLAEKIVCWLCLTAFIAAPYIT